MEGCLVAQILCRRQAGSKGTAGALAETLATKVVLVDSLLTAIRYLTKAALKGRDAFGSQSEVASRQGGMDAAT